MRGIWSLFKLVVNILIMHAMDECHLLLDRPCQYDRSVIYGEQKIPIP
jgi:hypothetical protein